MCGIEFCYAAETAFVSPTLLQVCSVIYTMYTSGQKPLVTRDQPYLFATIFKHFIYICFQLLIFMIFLTVVLLLGTGLQQYPSLDCPISYNDHNSCKWSQGRWLGDWCYQLLGSKWATTGNTIRSYTGHSWHYFPSVPSVGVMTCDTVQKRAMAS